MEEGRDLKYNGLSWLGVAILLSSVLIFGYSTKSILLETMFIAAIIFSFFYKRRLSITIFHEVVLIFAGVIISFLLNPPSKIPRTFNIPANITPVIFYISVALIWGMIISLFKKNKKHEFFMFYLYASLVLLISFIFCGYELDKTLFLLFSTYIVISLFYYGELISITYRPKVGKFNFSQGIMLRIVASLTLIVITYYGGKFLKDRETSILLMLCQKAPPDVVFSFDKNATLGKMEHILTSPQVLFRIKTNGKFSKVKSVSYNFYKNGRWELKSSFYPLKEEKNGAYKKFLYPFSLHKGNKKEASFTFASLKSKFLLHPQGVSCIYIDKNITVDELGNIFIEGPVSSYSITIQRDSSLPPPTSLDLQIPPHIENFFKDIAKKMSKGKNNRTKAISMEEYLRQNYQYHRGISLRSKKIDPVVEFLKYHRKAHCEYFASALVLLLRASGIPARYTVGFVTKEYNTLGKYYIIRQKDAHAWVEAYVDGKWITLDPTPPTPSESTYSYWQEISDFLIFKWQEAIAFIKGGEYRKLLNKKIAFFIILFLVLYLTLKESIMHKRIEKYHLKKESSSSHHIKKCMLDFEKKLKRYKISKPPNMTLMEFAKFLTELSNGKYPTQIVTFGESIPPIPPAKIKKWIEFVKKYHHIRYSKYENEITKEEINSLTKLLKEIEKIDS